MISDDEAEQQVSYWPSVSDLFMTLFITAIALVGVVLFVFLVNPGGDVFKGQIIELRNLLGLGPLPLESSPNDPSAVTDTINKAIAHIKACDQLKADVDALAEVQLKSEETKQKLKELTEKLTATEQERARLVKELTTLREKQEQSGSWIEQAREIAAGLGVNLDSGKNVRGGNDKPPIITIGADVLFPSGGAKVDETATGGLQAGGFREIADEILKRNAAGLRMVDTLEIIGHTDGLPMKGARGNLDVGLQSVLYGTAAIGTLKPGSNNDLGLLRALAIKQAWQEFIATHPDRPALECISVRTYSAGQTIPFDPKGPVDDERSRRIELRLTKLGVKPAEGCQLPSVIKESFSRANEPRGSATEAFSRGSGR